MDRGLSQVAVDQKHILTRLCIGARKRQGDGRLSFIRQRGRDEKNLACGMRRLVLCRHQAVQHGSNAAYALCKPRQRFFNELIGHRRPASRPWQGRNGCHRGQPGYRLNLFLRREPADMVLEEESEQDAASQRQDGGEG